MSDGKFSNDSPSKTILVTLAVCLVGAVMVAGSAVLLKPAHDANKARERQARLDEIIAGIPGGAGAVAVEARVIDLASGREVASIDAARFDARRAVRDPARDLAQIKRRARHAVVYLVRRDGRLRLVILPVHGRGFGSMIYGYLGLSGDTRTVIGLSFYEHGETPGLGALIDDRDWLGRWRGKTVWDDDGKPALAIASGVVDPTAPDAHHRVDGLTGATWTSRGVTNLLHFWLGEDGFGPFLRRLRER